MLKTPYTSEVFYLFVFYPKALQFQSVLSFANLGIFADMCGTQVGLDDFPQHESPPDNNLFEPTRYACHRQRHSSARLKKNYFRTF